VIDITNDSDGQVSTHNQSGATILTADTWYQVYISMRINSGSAMAIEAGFELPATTILSSAQTPSLFFDDSTADAFIGVAKSDASTFKTPFRGFIYHLAINQNRAATLQMNDGTGNCNGVVPCASKCFANNCMYTNDFDTYYNDSNVISNCPPGCNSGPCVRQEDCHSCIANPT
jgi:hypothetical protein